MVTWYRLIEKRFKQREYPNYTRAWLTFGLLDAGYAGEEMGFHLARRMGDHFNQCEVLPYVKDMNWVFRAFWQTLDYMIPL